MSIPKRGVFLEKLLANAEGKEILDVGCGRFKMPGAIGIDMIDAREVDINHDLNEFPWPLEDNRFDLVVFKHVIEHINDVERALAEIIRIAKDGAYVYIETPHYTNNDSWGDFTHIRHLNSRSLREYFTKTPPTMKELISYVDLKGKWKTLGLEWMINRVNTRPESRFWRKKVRDRWEKYYSFIIRGGNMYFVLKVVKE
ncbi:MAG: class I SAM-dependent methyltransferase [Thermodesulfobacteriota bacterium]